MMNATLIADLLARRQEAAGLHDRLRVRFPDIPGRQSPAFAEAMQPLLGDLKSIADTLRATPGVRPGEIARSLMWYGDALFDVAQGGHVPLTAARGAYHEAERYVRVANDPVLLAKYDGNYANILMKEEPRPATLREAVRRYEGALEVLDATPPLAAALRDQLGQARSLLAQFEDLDRELSARREEAKDLLVRLGRRAISPETSVAIADQLRALTEVGESTSLAEALLVSQKTHASFAGIMREAPPIPERASRPFRLSREIMRLWSELSIASLTPTIGAPLREAMFTTMQALVEISVALRESPPANVNEIERTRMRVVAANARRLLVHDHLTWIEPAWPAPPVASASNTIHVAGTLHLSSIARACVSRGLTITEPPPGRELGEARVDSLRRSLVTVIVVDGDPLARAATCYEAGIALALGKQLVVIGPSDGPLPFDLEVPPLTAPGGKLDEGAFGDALDLAMIALQRSPGTGHSDELLAAARRSFSGQTVLLSELEAHRTEPLARAALLENLVRAERSRTRIVAFPIWPPRHPTSDGRRLFHVMPVQTDWAADVKGHARRACGSAAFYRRHDDVEAPQIVRSLWDELTLATHVLVDLTGFNPNVLLELGVCHALGTPTLLVGQPGTERDLFPMLERFRVTEYGLDALDTLTPAIERFLCAG